MQINRRNDLSLRLLEIFGALMLHQTTVSAAAQLGISQPAVSIAINQLERQLGFSLFERRNKRLFPTEEARSLFKEVEPVFDHLRSVASRVRDLRDGTEGKLRIMATPPLGHSIVPPALRNFLKDRKGVTVHYDVRRMENVIEAVEFGAADLGLVLALDSHPAVSVQPLQTTEMVALVPGGHRLEDRETITPADAAGHGFIGLDNVSRIGSLLQSAFSQEGVPYEPRVEVRYCHTSAVLANSGIGISVVDPFTASFLTDLDLVQRRFTPSIQIGACLLTRADTPLSRLASGFVKEIEAVLSLEARANDPSKPQLEARQEIPD